MTKPNNQTSPDVPKSEARQLTPEAQRALEEAAARRKAHDKAAIGQAPEFGGRGGLDPGRYGDWEKNGTTSDF